MKKWIIMTSIVVLAIVGIVGLRIGTGVKNVLEELADAYAVWGTGELIVAYLEEKNGMPDSWKDLEPLWDEGFGMHARSGGIESIEDLRALIDIEFERLDDYITSVKDRTEPPHLIRPKSGAKTRWEGADTDEIVIYYLKSERYNQSW
ncbi:MAG: hypothetical protein ACQKBT_05240 [Puniceicoccales bacterium]